MAANPVTRTWYCLTGINTRLGLDPFQFLNLIYKVSHYLPLGEKPVSAML